MSSIFAKLAQSDLKNRRELPPVTDSSKGQGIVKIAIILSFIFSIAALITAFYLHQSMNAESRQRMALEASQVQFQEKAKSLENVINGYKEEIETLRKDVKEAQEDKIEIQTELQKSKTEIAAFKSKMNQLEDKARDIAVETVKKMNAVVARPLDVASDIVSPVSALPSQPVTPISGGKKTQVMTVNRKFNFVVVNIGSKDNLQMGAPLAVIRNGQKVASLKVEKLYETFAAATIVNEPANTPIHEGDIVQV